GLKMRERLEQASTGFGEEGQQSEYDDDGNRIPSRCQLAHEGKRFEAFEAFHQSGPLSDWSHEPLRAAGRARRRVRRVLYGLREGRTRARLVLHSHVTAATAHRARDRSPGAH